MGFTNRAPRWRTVVTALLLTGIGVLGTFLALLPEAVGIWSYVAATAVLIAGILFRRI